MCVQLQKSCSGTCFSKGHGNFLGLESCFELAMFIFKIKVSIILKMIQKKSYRAFRETVITCYLASASVIVNGVPSLVFSVDCPPHLCLFWFVCLLVFFLQSDTKYFRFHFQDASIPFRNLSELALWRDDNLFTDQRLAGLNPMSIKRISWDPGIQ